MTSDFEVEAEKFLKSIEMQNLEYLIRIGPGLIAWGEQRLASLWEESYTKKRAYKEAEAQAWKTLSDQTIGPKQKAPTQKHVEMVLPLDPRVQQAHVAYAECEKRRRTMEGIVKALDKANGSLPGMQGTMNRRG